MSALFGSSNCSGLVTPAGGRLVDLRVVGSERDELLETAHDLPTATLDPDAQRELILLTHGAYSPLDRFLGASERKGVLEDLRLADGAFFPQPVTLEISESEVGCFDSAASAALRSPEGDPLAVLDVDEVFVIENRAYLAGRPRALETPVDPAWRRFHWSPRETRECLDRYSRSNVVALEGIGGELDDVLEEVLWELVEALDGMLLAHPPGTPSEDLEALARGRRDRACVAVLPWVTPSPDDGPEADRDLLTRALAHRNYGANHLLVPAHREEDVALLERYRDETGITPIPWGPRTLAASSGVVEVVAGGAA